MLDALPDEAIGELLDRWSAKPTPQCEARLARRRAVAQVLWAQTAYAQCQSPYICEIVARSPDGTGFAQRAASRSGCFWIMPNAGCMVGLGV